ncbi:MAG: flagellar export chaperone FlgN [Desulfobacterium sp.]
MEPAIVQSIEKMIENKISLYHDLHSCFNEERSALIHVDVTALWQISSEKESLCLKITRLRRDITSAAVTWVRLKPFDLKILCTVIPRERLGSFHMLTQRLEHLKKEIEDLRKHNMVFMNDSLQFLDNMMTIISRVGKSEAPVVYNRRCSLNHGKTTRFLSQEV